MPDASEIPREHSLDEIIALALEQGVTQVEAAGSPLHPLLVTDRGQICVLFDESDEVDPLELACQAIKERYPDLRRCALVIDTRITLDDGKKWDAIIAMACERDQETGPIWAQRYVPKRLFRRFRAEGEREIVGQTRNFIKVALADA